jgi:hypothetical protein
MLAGFPGALDAMAARDTGDGRADALARAGLYSSRVHATADGPLGEAGGDLRGFANYGSGGASGTEQREIAWPTNR